MTVLPTVGVYNRGWCLPDGRRDLCAFMFVVLFLSGIDVVSVSVRVDPGGACACGCVRACVCACANHVSVSH